MGLPEQYTSARREAVSKAVETARGKPVAELVQMTLDEEIPFELRFAAGALLGLAGDPRIVPLDPPMCEVPAGRYTVGLDPERVPAVVEEFSAYGVRREWIDKEAPSHSVDLAGYRIARYPVTNFEYAIFFEETGHLPLPTSWRFGQFSTGRMNHPVHTVTAACADAYAAWLSARTGRRFRLPTEAEWEVAAGAGERAYPWGDAFLPDRANTVEAGLPETSPVGIFPAGRSPFRCLDMAGNVEEYVADSYRAYGGSNEVADDLLEQSPDYRVARGGSFTRFRDLARCSRRHGRYDSELYVMGFRIAECVQDASGEGIS